MPTSNKTAHSIFLDAWNVATKIEFNPKWKNKTGYLDYATDCPDLHIPKGCFVATTDDLDRKVLIKGLGDDLNLVVFERGRNEVLVSNLPSRRSLTKSNIDLFTIPFNSSLSKGTIETVVGLKNPTVVFYPEFSNKVLSYINKDTLVSVGKHLVTDIEYGLAIPIDHLKSIGIDINDFNIYTNIKDVNV